jgi:hypothetical protein
MADDQEQKPKLEGDDQQIAIKIKDQARCCTCAAPPPRQLGAFLLSQDAGISGAFRARSHLRNQRTHLLLSCQLLLGKRSRGI